MGRIAPNIASPPKSINPVNRNTIIILCFTGLVSCLRFMNGTSSKISNTGVITNGTFWGLIK
jgi:hypothetical protein